MSKSRRVAGIVAGVLILLSALAHSLLGAKELGKGLAAAGVPADLQLGVLAGWHWGGAAMLGFGWIVLATFARKGGGGISLVPCRVIALVYLLFGVGALLATAFDPFFVVFIVPGLALAYASFARGGASAGG